MAPTLAIAPARRAGRWSAGNALPSASSCLRRRAAVRRPRRRRGYLLSLVTRVMIFAIAALALDLLIGYGALVSFGHAAFIGLGAYAVGILGAHGITDALIALPVALAVAALFAFADRHRLPAHHGRLLHHDHARLRPNGLFHRELARALWRRRRPDHPRAHTAGRLSDLRQRPRALFHRPPLALLGAFTCCAARSSRRFGRVYRGARENPAAARRRSGSRSTASSSPPM